MADDAGAGAEIEDAALPAGWSSGQRRLAALLIGATAGINLLDRQVISILIEPIKAEFHLSDTQIGWLTGAGFAVPYALAAFPIAIALDRGVRKWVFGAALLIWSACTMASGLAISFLTLLAARIGVAVGESSAQPAQSSLLSDLYFGPRLSKAMSILPIGGAIGAALALFLGGPLTQHFGWRVTLFAVGAPGVLIALMLWLFFKEPPRHALTTVQPKDAPTLAATFKYLLTLPSLSWITLANAMAGVSGYVFLVWTPSLLVRVHHMALGDIGIWLGPSAALGMIAGAWLGGDAGARFGARNVSWYAWTGALGCLVAFPAAIWLPFAPSGALAIAAMVAATTFNVVYLAPSGALVQVLAPARMRAGAVAILGFWQTIAGVAVGPLMVGALSDYLQPRFGVDSLRYAMAVSALGCAVAAFALYRAGACARRDCERTRQYETAPAAIVS